VPSGGGGFECHPDGSQLPLLAVAMGWRSLASKGSHTQKKNANTQAEPAAKNPTKSWPIDFIKTKNQQPLNRVVKKANHFKYFIITSFAG
jgi:predicted RNA binding protein YcfA (HicA-like mRNA interferase family)